MAANSAVYKVSTLVAGGWAKHPPCVKLAAEDVWVMRGSFRQKSSGFTVVQMMISLTITAGMVGAAALAYYRGSGPRQLESARMELEEQHRIVFDRLRSDLSEAIRVSGSTATTLPGISRNGGNERGDGELVDGLVIRTPLFGQFTLNAIYAGNRAFTIDRSEDNSRTFDLFANALTQDGPRKISKLMYSNITTTNIVALESATATSVNGNPQLVLTWDANANPVNLPNDYAAGSTVLVALTQEITWGVSAGGELVRLLTRGQEVSTSVEIESVERFLINYFFGRDRGSGLEVVVPVNVQRDGAPGIPACTPAPPALCPGYQDVYKISVNVHRRTPNIFKVASWEPGDSRFQMDSDRRMLFRASETVNPYLQNLLLRTGGMGADLSCPLTSYASRCREECKTVFTGTTPWATDWWQFGDPESNYCKCAVRIDSGNQEIFYAPETTAGQYFIRHSADYGFGCDPNVPWCLNYDPWRDRWLSIQSSSQGDRLQACMRTFDICGSQNPTGDSTASENGFMMVPISLFACGGCTYTGGPYYGPDPDNSGSFRFTGMLDDGNGGLKITSDGNGSEVWDYISNPANSDNLVCGNWCPHEIVQFSFTPAKRAAWAPGPYESACRCRTRDQSPRTPTADDPSPFSYGADNVLATDLSAICDIDGITGLPWSDPGATSPRPASTATCPNAWDAANDRPRLRLPDNPQGLSEIHARVCECAREHNQQSTGINPVYFNFRIPEGGLSSLVTAAPYSGYPGVAWPGESSAWMNTPSFGAHSTTAAKSIPDFSATMGTNAVQVPGGRCDSVTCDYRWQGSSCCTAPEIVAEAATWNIPFNVNLGATAEERNKYAGYCHSRCGHLYDGEKIAASRIVTGRTYSAGVWEELPVSCGGTSVSSPGNPLTGGL